MSQHFLVRYMQSGDAKQREALRPQHIAYRKGLGAGLNLAGPILDDDGKPVGSVVIIAADDVGAALKVAGGDPYVQSGLLTIESLEQIRIAAMQPPTT